MAAALLAQRKRMMLKYAAIPQSPQQRKAKPNLISDNPFETHTRNFYCPNPESSTARRAFDRRIGQVCGELVLDQIRKLEWESDDRRSRQLPATLASRNIPASCGA